MLIAFKGNKNLLPRNYTGLWNLRSFKDDNNNA